MAVDTSLISPMVRPTVCIASTEWAVAAWISPILARISSVAFEVWLDRAFTSDATTAKPLPASPARAASIVALRARRSVCPAISLIRLTTSPMRCAASARLLIWALARSASLTARVVPVVERATCRLISAIDAVS